MSEEIEGDPIAHEDAIGRLLNSLRSAGPAALGLARSHLPGLELASNTTLRARGFGLADAELAHARHYGFESWPALRAELFRAGLDAEHAHGPYVRAVDALQAADRRRLERSLRDHPELVERGQGGRLEPLLIYAIECRDRKSVGLLVEAGAALDEPAHCGCLPVHRAAYGHPPEARPGPQREHRAILEYLLDVGAELEHSAHGAGGTPLAMALFWGHRSLAELLVERGASVPNLRAAAALGDAQRCAEFFDGSLLRPEAGNARGFYRPHDGFPRWKPSDDFQEILDEAFVWAAKNGRHGSLADLLERGADMNACPYDAPALVHVAGGGPLETLRWLLEHGADPAARGAFPQGSTALHLAAAQGHLEAVRLLVRKGAPLDLADEEFGMSAIGFAEWGGHQDIVDFLRKR